VTGLRVEIVAVVAFFGLFNHSYAPVPEDRPMCIARNRV
jgi:hypothetical protein